MGKTSAFVCAAGLLCGGASAIRQEPQTCDKWKRSACYEEKWVDSLIEADGGSEKVFVDVGCNTGTSAIKWAERWGSPGVMESWGDALCSDHHHCTGACGEPIGRRQQRQAQQAGGVAPGGSPARVLCVEPLPVNVKMLQGVNSKLGARSTRPPLEIVHAACSNETGLANFPGDAPAGKEDASLGQHYTGENLVSVPVKTVDEIMAERAVAKVDVLTIDAEGFDPLVLQGARETLRQVRLLVFEVHQDIPKRPWASTSLRAQVESLESQDFECYWPSNKHSRLYPTKGCLQDYGVGWANIACFRRGDAWHSAVQKWVH